MSSDAGGRPEVKEILDIHRQCVPEHGHGDEKRTGNILAIKQWCTHCQLDVPALLIINKVSDAVQIYCRGL